MFNKLHAVDFSDSLIELQHNFSVSHISCFTKDQHNDQMDSKDIRLGNLRKLIDLHGGAGRLADKVDTAAAYFSQIFSDKHPANLGDKLARKIEIKLGLPHGWMDVTHFENEENHPESIDTAPRNSDEHVVIEATSPEDLATKLSAYDAQRMLEIVQMAMKLKDQDKLDD